MSSINFHTKEISVKIVYYGPGLCGKTTSLQMVYNSLPPSQRPRLVSLATEVDRTIFFDFLPVTAYRIRDFAVRLQLYTVPGQVFYNATRKLVLNGVDGLVFVADSQHAMRDSNLESLQNLEDNLAELGLEVGRVPLVMQFNKRDLGDVDSLEEMDRLYNAKLQVPVFATVATSGEGIMQSLRAISQLVVNDLVRKGIGRQISEGTATPSASPATAPSAASSPSRGGGYGTVAEAVSRAASEPAEAPESLWPSGDATRWGERIERARHAGNWPELLIAVDQLLQGEARRWAASVQDASADPMPSFLLVRGAPAARFGSFKQALVAARSGRPVTKSEAMSALVLALTVLW